MNQIIKRDIQVSKSISEVVLAIKKLNNYEPSYTLESYDELLGQFKFTTGLFAGMYRIIIDVIEGDSGKTKITVEIQKQIGAIDEPSEISASNSRLQSIFEGISYIIQNPNDDFKDRAAKREADEKQGGKILKTILITVLSIIGLWIGAAIIMAICK